jgi:hypothetical protein
LGFLRSPWIASTGVSIILAVFLLPFFFVILRLMIFETVPRDHYEPFLLWLLGQPEGRLPSSPFGYRILPMVAAAPLYYLIPPVAFSGLPATISLPLLKATGAIAALSFLSVIATSVVVYRLAIDKANLGRVEALAASVVAFVFCWYAAIFALDSASICMLAVSLYLLDRYAAFVPFVLASVAFNEKIALILAIWLVMRCLLFHEDRAKLVVPTLAAVGAVALYIIILVSVRLPGNEFQTDLAQYPSTALANLKLWLDARGFALNILPVAVLFSVAMTSWRFVKQPFANGLFRPADILVIPALILLALVATEFYAVGRVVMHAAPLFVVPAGAAIGVWIKRPPVSAQT